MSSRYLLCLTLCALLLIGCVSVRPLAGADQIPVDQRVTLIDAGQWIGIYKVDNQNRGFGFVQKFEIPPGVHDIVYRGMTTGYAVGMTSADFTMKYDFKPGHAYVMRNDPNGGVFSPQIVDQQSGEELVPRSDSR